jgi:hypothetical protein
MKDLITLILVLCLFSYEKEEKTSIDNDYFLIGTLSDNMGRQKFKKVEERVDQYFPSEKQICLTIDSIFNNKYSDLEFSSSLNESSKKEIYELHSKKLAKKIDAFYSYEAFGGMAYIGEEDITKLNLDSLTKTKDFYSTNFDTIYTGKLKLNLFKTDKQKESFITGAYARYGWQSDSLYHIKIYNSNSKMRILNELLKDIGCTNVNYEIKKNIPTVHTVSFIPTEKLEDYFEKYKNLE